MKPVEIRTLDLRGRALTRAEYQAELPRAQMDVAAAVTAIEPILKRVANANEAELISLCGEFDGVKPISIRVPKVEISKALEKLDPNIRTALEEAIRRVKIVHSDQIRSEKVTEVVPGGSVTQRWIPVDRWNS